MRLIGIISTNAMVGIVLICLCAMNAWSGSPAFREDELLVRFKSDKQSRALEHYGADKRISTLRTLNGGRVHQLRLPVDLSVSEALEFYRNDPAVAYAEPNYLLSTQTMPDDPHFDRMWALSNAGQFVAGYTGTPGADLDAMRAWQITDGHPDIVVAVIDTGVNFTHPDIAANLWTNYNEIPGNGLDDDRNGFVDDVHGWDFVDDDNMPMDASGHGTHVAGIIAAQGNNAMGVAGVSWNVRMMPLRFMSAFDVGSAADAIAAIDYAISMGVRIINCSWGSNNRSSFLRETIANCGALFICAAGNAGTDNDIRNFYPAGYALDNVLSVAASDQTDDLTWFSNFGRQTVHVSAPGMRVFNLANTRRSVWRENFDTAGLDTWTSGGDENFWNIEIAPGSDDAALAGAPAGGYGPNVDAWIMSPALNLSQAAGARLELRVRGGCQAGADHLSIELSADQVTWMPTPIKLGGDMYSSISDALPSWTQVLLDLGPWDGHPSLFVRLRFRSDDTVSGEGFYIDDITISASAADQGYCYMAGTSMAAAFVSGLAALVHSQDPDLSARQTKEIILSSVDLHPKLKDRTISGGRINAYNALTLLSDLTLSASPASAEGVALFWTAREPLARQLVIERRADSQLEFTTVATVDSSAAEFVDHDLSANTTYYYRVYAQTRQGRNGYSNQDQATTLDYSAAGGNGASSAGGGGSGCLINTIK